MTGSHKVFGAFVLTTLVITLTPCFAQQSPYTYTIEAPYAQIIKMDGSTSCNYTLYEPDVFTISGDGALDNTLYMYTQGGAYNVPPALGLDSIWRMSRDYFTGQWTTPASTSAAMTGPPKCDHLGRHQLDPVGPIASPDVVRVNGVYYMAYVAGNADYERGRVYWRKSTDGASWIDLGNPSDPTPILLPVDSHHPDFCEKHGVGSVELVYQAPYFYFFATYFHEESPLVYDGPYTTIIYRIKYDVGQPFGLSINPSDRQIWRGGWRQHNGQLVFDYDDPVNGILEGDRPNKFAEGGGDVIYDPRIQKWIHIYAPGGASNVLQFQTTTTSALDSFWTDPKTVQVVGSFPGGTRYSPGMWYGQVSQLSQPTMYIFVPVVQQTCSPYAGLGIASAQLTVSTGQ